MSRKSNKKRKFKYRNTKCRNTKCRNTKRKYNRKNINIKTKKKMKGGSKTKTSGSINSEYTNLEVAKTKLILARSTSHPPLDILPPELIECIADNIKHNYKVGENVILKPIKPYGIQYKNVRIDEIDNEIFIVPIFIGTINFSNGKMKDNYKFYLYEIMKRVIPSER